MIGLISAAVAIVLCLGIGCAGLVVYYLRLGTTDSASDSGDNDPRPTESGNDDQQPADPSRPLPQSCSVTAQSPGPEIKTVGVPDFDRAPRTGTATMRITTNLGPIVITMDRSRTPCTAASFQHLAERRFFDQSPCHRLVTEGIFVLQCGDPTGTESGGPDYRFADENLSGARYTRGVVAMANIGQAATNGSQFFIIFRDSTSLPPTYTPFGTVTTGLDIVDQVAAGGHDNSNPAGGGTPNTPITIETLTVEQ